MVLTHFQPLDIATDRCKGCELCIGVCPHHVLALDESVVNALGYHPVELTDPAGCTSEWSPEFLELWDIEEDGRVVYEAWLYMSDSGTFYHAGTTRECCQIIQCGISEAGDALEQALFLAVQRAREEHSGSTPAGIEPWR